MVFVWLRMLCWNSRKWWIGGRFRNRQTYVALFSSNLPFRHLFLVASFWSALFLSAKYVCLQHSYPWLANFQTRRVNMSVQTLSLASLRHVITRPITLNALLPKTKTLRSEKFRFKVVSSCFNRFEGGTCNFQLLCCFHRNVIFCRMLWLPTKKTILKTTGPLSTEKAKLTLRYVHCITLVR